MHIYNNLDVRRAVIKLFGEAVRHSIRTIEKTGNTFKVYIDGLHVEPLSLLPEGVRTYREGERTVVVFESRDIDVRE